MYIENVHIGRWVVKKKKKLCLRGYWMPPKINCILIFQRFKLKTQVIDFKNSFRYVWPWAKDISIAHDSYLCKNYPFTKAFPTQRRNEPNNFVGSVVSENANLWQECPKECRPKNHLDWIHC